MEGLLKAMQLAAAGPGNPTVDVTTTASGASPTDLASSPASGGGLGKPRIEIGPAGWRLAGSVGTTAAAAAAAAA